MNQLHPGAVWSFRFRAYFVLLFLGVFIGGWLIGPIVAIFFTFIFGFAESSILPIILITIGFYIIFVFVIGEIYSTMAYNRWKYEFTGSQLRIERGIIWKRYSNIPFERVQNVDITRGILARILGFSTVNIQTAGYSYAGRGMPMSEGYIPAVSVDEAEHIREFLMKKITKRGRSQGI